MVASPTLSNRASDGKEGFKVLSFDEDETKVREVKRRKMHRKTKSGCLTCKARRVKCDETRPVCVRCQRNSRPCTYNLQSVSYERSDSSTIPVLNDAASISSLSAVTVIPFSCPSTKNGTSSLHLMQHFDRHWSDIFSMPRGDAVVGLFRSDPLVRNTMLALTASHLRHVSLGTRDHRIAEHFQQCRALQHYQKALKTPRELFTQSMVHSLMLSATLLNMLAFELPETEAGSSDLNPGTCWVFSSREDRLGWLAMQAGLKPLLLSVTEFFDETVSFLTGVFLGDEKDECPIHGTNATLDDVPAHWIKALRLRTDNQSRSCDIADVEDSFRPLLMILSWLRSVDPTPANIIKCVQFLGKVHSEFRSLLYVRDERAMWVFGYWLGILCRFEGAWWCDRRARRDYEAIRMWLRKLRLGDRPGTEGELWNRMMIEYDSVPVFVGSAATMSEAGTTISSLGM